jgi:hypothetical protein
MQLLRTDPPSSDFAVDCHCMFPVVVGRIERCGNRCQRVAACSNADMNGEMQTGILQGDADLAGNVVD